MQPQTKAAECALLPACGCKDTSLMLERLYMVSEEDRGWGVRLNKEKIALFASKEEAFAAAVDAARTSRQAGHYAWVKLRHREVVSVD
jgi:hypothetical protein